jgi:hypothetical protein
VLVNNVAPDGPRALSEAFGDWGAAVADAHTHQGAISPSTWQISDFRNLQAPVLMDVLARDWFPSRTLYVDNLATAWYRNSTIMGHAFYLLAIGGQHYRAGLPGSGVPVIPVTGIGFPAARQIFYDAVTLRGLNETTTFFSMRDKTVASAPTEPAKLSAASMGSGRSQLCLHQSTPNSKH